MPEQLLTNFKLLFQSMKQLSGWKDTFKHEKSKVMWRAAHLFWDVCSPSPHEFLLSVVIQPAHLILSSFHLSISLNTNTINKPQNQTTSPPNLNVKQTHKFEEFPSKWLHLSESSVLKWEMSLDLLDKCCGYFLCLQTQQRAKILTLVCVCVRTRRKGSNWLHLDNSKRWSSSLAIPMQCQHANSYVFWSFVVYKIKTVLSQSPDLTNTYPAQFVIKLSKFAGCSYVIFTCD